MSFGVLLLGIGGVWILSEILLDVLCRSGSVAQKKDAGSQKLLNVAIYASLAVAVAVMLSGIGRIERTGAVVPWIGVCLIVLGLVVRWSAILTLGRFFTVDVAIHSDHRLVTKGMYRIVRHPSYSGMVVSFAGLGLAFDNWISLLTILLCVVWGLKRRIAVEESALLEEFGEEYATYCKTTWKMIPGLY